MAFDSILWRRLDSPGHDACRLEQTDAGWRLEGAASFRHDSGPASLSYHLACDRAWRTTEGSIVGWVGPASVAVRVKRTADGVWTLNGAAVPQVNGCHDLDLGFTPATNVFQLRRIALEIGESEEVPVAWLDVPAGTLEVLQQRYERRTEGTYWYEAPRFEYAALLEVTPVGFARQYPGLWEAER